MRKRFLAAAMALALAVSAGLCACGDGSVPIYAEEYVAKALRLRRRFFRQQDAGNVQGRYQRNGIGSGRERYGGGEAGQ